MRPEDVMPKMFIDCAKTVPINKVKMESCADGSVKVGGLHNMPVSSRLFCKSFEDWAVLLSVAVWLQNGPKMVRFNAERQHALTQVAVTLDVADYEQPFPAILIVIDTIKPFKAALVVKHGECLHVTLISSEPEYDVALVLHHGLDIEKCILKWDAPFDEELKLKARNVCRLALNTCLLLMEYPYETRYLIPKEGPTSRKPNPYAMQAIVLEKTIKLHDVKYVSPKGELTGRTVAPHWRRGHWRMQPYGPENSLRKRILIKATFIGEIDVYQNVTYKS